MRMSSHETDKQEWAHMGFVIQILITDNLTALPLPEEKYEVSPH